MKVNQPVYNHGPESEATEWHAARARFIFQSRASLSVAHQDMVHKQKAHGLDSLYTKDDNATCNRFNNTFTLGGGYNKKCNIFTS